MLPPGPQPSDGSGSACGRFQPACWGGAERLLHIPAFRATSSSGMPVAACEVESLVVTSVNWAVYWGTFLSHTMTRSEDVPAKPQK